MSENSPPTSPGPQRRRSSFAELFTSRSVSYNGTNPTASSPPASVPNTSSASAPKRMSLAALGLGGTSPTQGSAFDAFARQRRASMTSSSASGSPEFRNTFGSDPAVVEEVDDTTVPMNTPATPSFVRRMSFGAQALRERSAGGPAGGKRAPSTLSPKGPASTSGEGFNWSEALRDKTRRQPSVSGPNPFALNTNKPRAATVATVEPPKEMPKAPTPLRSRKPDHLGERMLRGEFMMD